MRNENAADTAEPVARDAPGGADAYLVVIAAIDAADIAKARLAAEVHDVADTDFWLWEAGAFALVQIIRWAEWHLARVQARRIYLAEVPLTKISDAVEHLLTLMEEDAEDKAFDAGYKALSDAVSAAQGAAEVERRDANDPRGGHLEIVHQAREVCASPIGEWVSVFGLLDECRRFARQRPAEAQRFYLTALHRLAFGAPLRVDQLPE